MGGMETPSLERRDSLDLGEFLVRWQGTEAPILGSSESDGGTDPLPRESSQANGGGSPILGSKQSNAGRRGARKEYSLCPGGAGGCLWSDEKAQSQSVR